VNARVPDRCENDRRRALKNARQRRYGVTHKGKAARRRDAMLQRYGITVQQYDKMFALQDGKCVGCGRPPKTRRLSVEHDHKSKRVRGLACHNCNRHLIAKNTAETARWLVAYLSSEFDGRTLGLGR
jgi:hypothetical protein